MASKLDQSLDAIIGDRPTTRRGRGDRRTRSTRAAPVGGVKKAVATAKGAASKAAAKITNKNAKAESAVPAGGATKIIVSNLPTDVNEAQIKEYFQQVAGPVKRVWLTYGPSGQSRGIATIQFVTAAAGGKAMEQRGTKVDGRAIRVEAVVNETAPAKSLRERARSAPNAQPKKLTAETAKTNERGAARGAKTAGRAGRGRTTRGRNAGRPKKKTADELDAEMTDYFGSGSGATGGAAPAGAAPAAAAAGGDDMGMDEIS